MRQKELKLIITFHTTAEAIAMEKVCKKDEVPGRLIPVPRQISSGCGLSFCMPVEWKDKIEAYMEKQVLHYESLGEYWVLA